MRAVRVGVVLVKKNTKEGNLNNLRKVEMAGERMGVEGQSLTVFFFWEEIESGRFKGALFEEKTI